MDDLQVFDMVIFGATGDLATRKLLPALYYRHRDGQLPDGSRIIGTGRSALAREVFHKQVEKACRAFVPAADFDLKAFKSFVQRAHYVAVNAAEGTGYGDLHDLLDAEPDRVRVFFLATSPDWFAAIAEQLAKAGLATPKSRIVLEKPLGHDLASAREINTRSAPSFAEQQIYRIDHYLGKETVQNLMALRFGNAIFEPLWHRDARRARADHRRRDRRRRGARRLLRRASARCATWCRTTCCSCCALIAMEPPTSSHADAIRDEKVKVLRALRRCTPTTPVRNVVRGAVRARAQIGGKAVPGYARRRACRRVAHTETFVALSRSSTTGAGPACRSTCAPASAWPRKVTEIVIDFATIPYPIFRSAARYPVQNRLVIRLQPRDEVMLYVLAKQPGDGMELTPVELAPGPGAGVQQPADGGLRAPPHGRALRPPGALHAQRRAGGGLGLRGPHHPGLGGIRGPPPWVRGRNRGSHGGRDPAGQDGAECVRGGVSP